MRGVAMRAGRASLRHAVARTAILVPAVLVLVLHAVAGVVPLEPLHIAGLWDGADYDSLIQPLVVGLADASLPVVAAIRPVCPAAAATGPATPDAPGAPTARRPPSRAPPLA
jgi:hypothetical protein